MLVPPTAAALCGPGLVLRCMSQFDLEAMVASLQSVAFAALLFSLPISWAVAATIMSAPARRQPTTIWAQLQGLSCKVFKVLSPRLQEISGRGGLPRLTPRAPRL